MKKVFISFACLFLATSVYADIATDLMRLGSGEWYKLSGANADASNLCESAGGLTNITAYSSGAYDSVSNRWLMFGGGHSDYNGNEICAFSFNDFSWSLLEPASTQSVIDECFGANCSKTCDDTAYLRDGKPRSRHTYDHLVFDPVENALVSINAKAVAGWCPTTSFSAHDYFDFDDSLWHTDRSVHSFYSQLVAQADANGDIWAIDTTDFTTYGPDYRALRLYDKSEDTWTAMIGSLTNVAMADNGTSAIGGGYLVAAGLNASTDMFSVYDISDKANPSVLSTSFTGSDGWYNSKGGGIAYNEDQGVFVGWGDDDTKTVYVLKVNKATSTYHWTEIPGTGAVTPSTTSDTYPLWKKWMYVPTGNYFAVFPAFSEDPYIYKFAMDDDATRPEVTGFAATSPYDTNLDVPITTFTATDNDRVVLYAVTDEPIHPEPWGFGWSNAAPTSFTVSAAGVHTLFAWAMDASGNVSAYGSATVEVQCQTKTVCSSGCDYTGIRAAVVYANTNSRQVTGANPNGYAVIVDIDATDSPYQIWRGLGAGEDAADPNCGSYMSDNYDDHPGLISASGITLRGSNGTPKIEYLCTSREVDADRWGVGYSNGHGSMIVQETDSDDLRIENLEIAGGTDFNKRNGAGVWVEPSADNLTIVDSIFHDNDNGILTSENTSSTIIILNSYFYNNGAFVGPEGQAHNLYIGQIDKLFFIGNRSSSAYRGQLLKSRAGTNYIFANRLSDEADIGLCDSRIYCSNFIMDFSNGGDVFVVGNILYKGNKATQDDFITYAREVYYVIDFTDGGGDELTDGTVLTNTRTSATWTMRYIYNYGATGSWVGGDYATHIDFCSLNSQPTCSGLPEYEVGSGIETGIVAGDVLTYGATGKITVATAEFGWADGNSRFYMEYNTIVNDNTLGYKQHLIRGLAGATYSIKNNAILSRTVTPLEMKATASTTGEAQNDIDVTEQTDGLDASNNYWLRSVGGNFGFVDISSYDYHLTQDATKLIGASVALSAVGDHDLSPSRTYAHPANTATRPSASDIGAYEYVRVNDGGSVRDSLGIKRQ